MTPADSLFCESENALDELKSVYTPELSEGLLLLARSAVLALQSIAWSLSVLADEASGDDQ